MPSPTSSQILTTDSPFFTASPGDFSHDTIFPSVMVELSAGMNTSFTAHRFIHLLWLGPLDTNIGAALVPTLACMFCMSAIHTVSGNDFL